jgi:hypothetical protein
MLVSVESKDRQIGCSGVFTRAILSLEEGFVEKQMFGGVSSAEYMQLDKAHREFIARIKSLGIAVPDSVLILKDLPDGSRLVVKQRAFSENSLATNLVSNANPDIALKTAQLVFRTTLHAVGRAGIGSVFRGFHGSLRNYAIEDINSPEPKIYFLDTFPPFSSPQSLLDGLARFARDDRLRIVAEAAKVLPDSILRQHSIFNPVTMLAGICHSVHRRRQEISAALILSSIAEVKDSAPEFADSLLNKLQKGFDNDPFYRRFFAFLVRDY